MKSSTPLESGSPSLLCQISTRWSLIHEPRRFVLRYAPAIRKYIGAMIRNPHDAEEVTQDFLVRMLQRGFQGATPERGRFRDYLKIAVRNAALTYLHRKHAPLVGEFNLEQVPEPAAHSRVEQEWLADWKRALLDRAWEALGNHERKFPGNLCFTVLKLAADHPEEDSKNLAARAAASSSRPLSPEAFRKQLSRARRLFAELLLVEVRQTLEHPTYQEVEDELNEIGLMEYVRDFLPTEWRSHR